MTLSYPTPHNVYVATNYYYNTCVILCVSLSVRALSTNAIALGLSLSSHIIVPLSNFKLTFLVVIEWVICFDAQRT